ncbi:MAG TPA: helix-turn-helix transcriptional regulator [Candidatus Angelobacter sp.]|nr:helix-turn-helix transcriptional regulator [Candidatus Angelobacter sp.]
MNSIKHKHATRLWVARKQRRLSQKQVARLIGHKSTTMLSKYEQGERPPPLFVAMKLAIVYQSSLEELLPILYKAAKTEVLKAQLKNLRAT